MKEYAELKNRKPIHAEGHPCIMLTDPLTGKIKEKIEGKNHVFPEALMSGNSQNWINMVSQAYTCCMDNTNDIDTEIPYLLGQVVGYGIPSNAGSGTYQGAYNTTNQILAAMSPSSVRWKFQYDFTAPQANGTIGSIGLTTQYTNSGRVMLNGLKLAHTSGKGMYTSDGRYSYSMDTPSIVTRYDLWTNTSSTIDLSASIPLHTTGQYETVGYAPVSGRYYVQVYAYGAPTSNKMYEFSDATFSTLLNIYTLTYSGKWNYYYGGAPLYIYENMCYYFGNGSAFYPCDFKNDGTQTSVTVTDCNAIPPQWKNTNLAYGTCPIKGSLVMLCHGHMGYYPSPIFDLATGTIKGHSFSPHNADAATAGGGYGLCKHPLTTEKLICAPATTNTYVNGAVSAYKLPTPITKTSANGMTVIYELEVFW